MIKINFRSYSNQFIAGANKIVLLPSTKGVMGILPYHENMVVSLQSGLIIIDETIKYFIYEGIATIQDNVIDIISDFIKEVNDLEIQNIDDEIAKINYNLAHSKTNTEISKYEKDIKYYSLFKEYSLI